MDETFKQRRKRIGALTLTLAGLFALTAVRLAIIVLVDGPRLVSLGHNEQSAEIELAAVRGPIIDRDGKPLALSAETQSVYAHPRTLLGASSPAERARLAELLGLRSAELESRLLSGSGFVWLARHLAPARAREIEQIALKGVGAVSEYKRFYPESNLAAAVVGMAGIDGQGLSGVELQYDRLVRGEPVGLHFYQDALGHPILDSPLQLKEPKMGARLELTIDSSIQAEAEHYLATQVAQSGAAQGTAVIIDPFTGEVLALANVGKWRAGNGQRLHDSAVQDAFEPGSTIKGLLGAIALEDRVIDTDRRIYCEQGQWDLAGNIIHDEGRYGWLSLSGILEVSSNIGAAKLALALGNRRLYDGIAAFGLGRKTGIDLPGEAAGMVRPASSWREIELANHGFGQGLAVTPIQLATAYAAIANGGLLMRPYVVKAAYDAEGPVLIGTPRVVRRAISPGVAHTMNEVLRGVVNGREGTAHLARISDFTVAGKTGTAQVVDPKTRKYYRDRLIASFVGFVPAEDPKFVILVVLYNVARGHFGGQVAAPVFSEIASNALQRMAVAPAPPKLEDAAILPIGMGFFSPRQGEDNDRNSDSVNAPPPDVSESHAGELSGDESSHNGLYVPDFRGLSLRSALAVARVHRLALQVKGDGYVVDQEPPPGSSTRSERTSILRSGIEDVRIVLADPGQWVREPVPPWKGSSALSAPGKMVALAAPHSRPGRSSPLAKSSARRSPRVRGRQCPNGFPVGASCWTP